MSQQTRQQKNQQTKIDKNEKKIKKMKNQKNQDDAMRILRPLIRNIHRISSTYWILYHHDRTTGQKNVN